MNNINKIFNYERNIINDNNLFLDQMIYKMFKIATNNLQCLKKYEGVYKEYTSYVKSLLTACPFPCAVEESSCFVGVKYIDLLGVATG